MKVIFLDIDGVLNQRGELFPRHDPFCVLNLNTLVHYTGAKIVITSNQRIIYNFGFFAKTLKEWGIEGEIVGTTPQPWSKNVGLVYAPSTRAEEIQSWLLSDGPDVSHFAILDDDISQFGRTLPEGSGWATSLSQHLVVVDARYGLTVDNVADALKLLMNGRLDR